MSLFRTCIWLLLVLNFFIFNLIHISVRSGYKVGLEFGGKSIEARLVFHYAMFINTLSCRLAEKV